MKKINLMGVTYTAKVVGDATFQKRNKETGIDTPCVGFCNKSTKQIYVHNNFKEEDERTLTHEILHGICYEGGIEVKQFFDVAEEVFIQLLTPSFYRFIKDNTNFFKEK